MFDDDFPSLIGRIYDAAGDASLWATLIEELAGRTKSTAAALVIQARDEGLYAVSNSWGLPEEFARAYRDHYYKLDIWAEVVVPNRGRYPGGYVCTSESLCPVSVMRKKEFYNDHLVNAGIEHALFELVENNNSCVAAVAMYRDNSSAEFGEPEMNLLRLLAPHLRRAFCLYRRFSLMKSTSQGVEEALDTLPIGVVFFDGKGEIVLMNRSGAACLAERDGLLATRTALRAEVAAESSKLQQMIQQAAATSRGNGTSSGGAIAISRRARPALQLQISPIRNSAVPVSRSIAAVALIHDPLRAPRSGQETLRAVYGLTPAESRVALLLADGHSPRQICERIGVTENTVRTQIKSIFSKTGVRRQSELIRVLLSGAPPVVSPGTGSHERAKACGERTL